MACVFCQIVAGDIPAKVIYREDGVTAFTEYGIECLKQIIADESAAGRAPAKIHPTE